MGIQTLVVFTGVTIALALGITTVALGASLRVAGWMAIGLVPFMWALLHLIERLLGREIWHYTAPYPYRRMKGAPVAEPVLTTRERHEPREEWDSLAAA
jgi:hypothetical protein